MKFCRPSELRRKKKKMKTVIFLSRFQPPPICEMIPIHVIHRWCGHEARGLIYQERLTACKRWQTARRRVAEPPGFPCRRLKPKQTSPDVAGAQTQIGNAALLETEPRSSQRFYELRQGSRKDHNFLGKKNKNLWTNSQLSQAVLFLLARGRC